MASNVVIRDVTYNSVPSVEIPLADGQGVAVFVDTSDATLNLASQLADGVTAYSNGVKFTGDVPTRDSSDLTVSGATVTVPAGNYATSASASVANGSVTAPATITGSSASVSAGTNTLTLSKTIAVTPNVSTAGYIAEGTAGNSAVSLTASVPTKNATTYTPSTANQTIASGTYLNGVQTILGDSNLVSAKIVYPYAIFGVEGSAKLPVISQDATTKVLSIS